MTTRTNLAVLCSVWLLQCSSALAEYYDVVVIGAGWAGLGAAKTMQESDEEVSVLILDAHDYVGGRCKSTEMFDGAVYEEGTAYLTGIESNPVYDYGVSVGTEFVPHAYSYDVYRGRELFYGDKFWSYYDGIWEAWDSQYYDELLDVNSTLADVIAGYNRTQLLLDPHVDKNETALFAAASERVSYDYAAVLSKFAVYGGNYDSSFPGGIALAKHGLGTIVQSYAESLLNNIKLNSKVTKVDYSQTPVVITYQDTKSGVETMVEAAKVLVTVPFGVLKAGDIEFSPPFAENGEAGLKKQRAIDNMNPGKYEKIALFWEGMTEDEIFWNTDVEHYMHIAEEDEPDQQGNFTHWNSYYHVAGIPILESSASQRFVDVIETLSDAEVVAQAVERLRKYYGEDKVPDPTHHFLPRWYQEEYTKTIYAYAEPGAGWDVRTDLAAALDDRLFFAGEATIEERFGTAPGALLSGVNVVADMFPPTEAPSKTPSESPSKTPSKSNSVTSAPSALPVVSAVPSSSPDSAASFPCRAAVSLFFTGFGTIVLVLY